MKKITPIQMMAIVAMANIIAVLLSLIISDGTFLSELIWDARNPFFVDFQSHIDRVRDLRPYDANDWDARFPALAYLFFYILGRIIPTDMPDTLVTNWYDLFCNIILCINVWLIAMLVERIVKDKRIATLVGIIFFLSQTFALAEIKAGNSAIYALTLVLAALYLKDSESKVAREVALILIAIAAGIKISPAIFGFLYIKEKRYKEAGRLIVYGILFFFLPYSMFGGIEAIKTFLAITSQVSNATNPRPETIIGVCLQIADILGLGSSTGLIMGKICSFGYLIIVLVLLFIRKSDWKSLFLLSSLMIIFVNQSYPYTLQYLLIPMVAWVCEFINEKRLPKKIDYVYGSLFALVFCGYPFLRIDWPCATFITNYFWLYIFVAIVVVDSIISKNKKLED